MRFDSNTVTALVADQFGHDRRITLKRQPNGLFEEVEETPEAAGGEPADAVTAVVEGRLGVEHRIKLVRKAGGDYEEVVDPADYGQF